MSSFPPDLGAAISLIFQPVASGENSKRQFLLKTVAALLESEFQEKKLYPCVVCTGAATKKKHTRLDKYQWKNIVLVFNLSTPVLMTLFLELQKTCGSHLRTASFRVAALCQNRIPAPRNGTTTLRSLISCTTRCSPQLLCTKKES